MTVVGPASSLVTFATFVLLAVNIVIERDRLGELIVPSASSTSTTTPVDRGRGAPSIPSSSARPSTTRSAQPSTSRLRARAEPAVNVEIDVSPTFGFLLTSAAQVWGLARGRARWSRDGPSVGFTWRSASAGPSRRIAAASEEGAVASIVSSGSSEGRGDAKLTPEARTGPGVSKVPVQEHICTS